MLRVTKGADKLLLLEKSGIKLSSGAIALLVYTNSLDLRGSSY